MKKLMAMFLFILLTTAAYAQVSDLVLQGFSERNVVVVKTDGSEVSGQLLSYDAISVVVIKADGLVVEIPRYTIASIRLYKAETAAPAPAPTPTTTYSGDKPLPPNLASMNDKSPLERQAAYDGQFKITVDPSNKWLKMGIGGQSFPLAQWEPVFRDFPDVYQLYQGYNGRYVTYIIFFCGGTACMIPGMIMSFWGPYLIGIIFDVAALACDIVALIVLPTDADLFKIADAYNAHTKKSLQLGSIWPPDTSTTAMYSLSPPPGVGESFTLTLISLKL